MARPRKLPKLKNVAQGRFLKQRFLQTVLESCPEVFETLRVEIPLIEEQLCQESPDLKPQDLADIERDRLDPKLVFSAFAWAARYGVEGTWVVDEVKEVLEQWFRFPELRAPEPPYLPLSVLTQNIDGDLSFQLSITVPEYLGFSRPYFVWENLESYLRSQLQPMFEEELIRFKASTLENGVLRNTNELSDERRDFKALALYLFRNWSSPEIATSPGLYQERTTIWRSVRNAADAVGLTTALNQLIKTTKRRSRRIPPGPNT